MKKVSSRDFQLNAAKYLRELPIILTSHNIPVATVIPYMDINNDQIDNVRFELKSTELGDPIMPEKNEIIEEIKKQTSVAAVIPYADFEPTIDRIPSKEEFENHPNDKRIYEILPPSENSGTPPEVFKDADEAMENVHEAFNKKEICPFCNESVPAEFVQKHYNEKHSDL